VVAVAIAIDRSIRVLTDIYPSLLLRALTRIDAKSRATLSHIDRRENARDLSLFLSLSSMPLLARYYIAAVDIPTERTARRFHNG